MLAIELGISMFVPKRKQAKMGLMDLPVEILMEIFKRLPVKSVYRLRCVSKTLLDLVDTPRFVSLHSLIQIATNSAAEVTQLLLCLVRSYRWSRYRNAMALESLDYDSGKGKVTGSEIMSMDVFNPDCNVHFVFHNLFCLRVTIGPDERCFLIDPFREEVLRLPTSDRLGEDRCIKAMFYGMGFDKITSTYKIVRLSRFDNGESRKGKRSWLEAQVHVMGTSTWHEIPAPFFATYLVDHYYYIGSICAYRDMHWIFQESPETINHIISFDFTKEEFYSIPHPTALSTETFLRYITLKGSMTIVNFTEIWVMKDYNTKEWTLEYNIDLRAFGFRLELVLTLQTAYCAEWENGIVYISDESDTSFSFDLNHVTYQIRENNNWRNTEKILCFKRSLISLKEFGKLVEEPGSHSLLDFSRKYLCEEFSEDKDDLISQQ